MVTLSLAWSKYFSTIAFTLASTSAFSVGVRDSIQAVSLNSDNSIIKIFPQQLSSSEKPTCTLSVLQALTIPDDRVVLIIRVQHLVISLRAKCPVVECDDQFSDQRISGCVRKNGPSLDRSSWLAILDRRVLNNNRTVLTLRVQSITTLTITLEVHVVALNLEPFAEVLREEEQFERHSSTRQSSCDLITLSTSKFCTASTSVRHSPSCTFWPRTQESAATTEIIAMARLVNILLFRC